MHAHEQRKKTTTDEVQMHVFLNTYKYNVQLPTINTNIHI